MVELGSPPKVPRQNVIKDFEYGIEPVNLQDAIASGAKRGQEEDSNGNPIEASAIKDKSSDSGNKLHVYQDEDLDSKANRDRLADEIQKEISEMKTMFQKKTDKVSVIPCTLRTYILFLAIIPVISPKPV